MAQVVNLRSNSSPSATGLVAETYICSTLTDLAVVITPVTIKRVENVIVNATNAAAATALVNTIYSFVETSTDTTVTVTTGANNCELRITILGAA